jgi:hypothetical protein
MPSRTARFVGVRQARGGKWTARVNRTWLGTHDTEYAAARVVIDFLEAEDT